MQEAWKAVEGYEDNYEVSNQGRVRRIQSGKVLKPSSDGGYLYVVLCKNSKAKWFQVHRLVAQAFIPNPDNKPHVNHINGIKNDNCVENLEWVTRSSANSPSCMNEKLPTHMNHVRTTNKLVIENQGGVPLMEAKNISKSSEIKVKYRKSTKTAPKDPVLEELKQLYSNLTCEKKIICYAMLEEVAFLKNTLEGLRKDIVENGTTDEYKNGANQYGKKISASLQSYNNTLKNYYALLEKLTKMFPLESEQNDELLELINS